MPMLPFLKIFNGLLFGWTLWMYWPHLKSGALLVPEIVGGTQKIWAVHGYVHSPFSAEFWIGFFRMAHVIVLAKFVVRRFTRSWHNSDWSFGWGLRTPIFGKRRPWGSGMVPLERAVVSSYRLSVVTFPLSLRVSEILPLLCSITPLFPTPHLVSSKFSHVPQSGWWMAFGLQRAKVLG